MDTNNCYLNIDQFHLAEAKRVNVFVEYLSIERNEMWLRGVCEISQILEAYISMHVIVHPSFPWTWRIVVDTRLLK